MVWNAPSWPLKGDNWKIQDEATVKVGMLCYTELAIARIEEENMDRRNEIHKID